MATVLVTRATATVTVQLPSSGYQGYGYGYPSSGYGGYPGYSVGYQGYPGYYGGGGNTYNVYKYYNYYYYGKHYHNGGGSPPPKMHPGVGPISRLNDANHLRIQNENTWIARDQARIAYLKAHGGTSAQIQRLQNNIAYNEHRMDWQQRVDNTRNRQRGQAAVRNSSLAHNSSTHYTTARMTATHVEAPHMMATHVAAPRFGGHARRRSSHDHARRRSSPDGHARRRSSHDHARRRSSHDDHAYRCSANGARSVDGAVDGFGSASNQRASNLRAYVRTRGLQRARFRAANRRASVRTPGSGPAHVPAPSGNHPRICAASYGSAHLRTYVQSARHGTAFLRTGRLQPGRNGSAFVRTTQLCASGGRSALVRAT